MMGPAYMPMAPGNYAGAGMTADCSTYTLTRDSCQVWVCKLRHYVIEVMDTLDLVDYSFDNWLPMLRNANCALWNARRRDVYD
jgi:hypothetical protein